MKINRPKRKRSGAKRLDLTDMRKVLRDRRMWCALGVVINPGDGDHWSVVPGVGGVGAFDVVVEVELQPSQVTVTARLRAGLWEVPNEGDEVIVVMPDGEIDFQPTIVARLSSGSVPTVQGPQPDRTVIVNDEVVIHDGLGGAERAVKGETYRSAEDSFFSSLDSMVAALAAAIVALQTAVPTLTGTPPQQAAWATAATAVGNLITPFANAVIAFNAGTPGYLTTVLKAK